jgi:type IV pilus assembly protein PilE
MHHFMRSIQRAPANIGGAHISAKSGRRRNELGFTLVELMIVVVVIGVLAAVAIPSYRSSVMKSNRAAAKTALLDLAAREEKYYSLNNNYSGTNTTASTVPVDLFGSSTTITFPMNVPMTGTALYTIAAPVVTIPGGTAPNYVTLTATPVSTGPQAHDKCGNFILSTTGVQSVSGTGSCW